MFARVNGPSGVDDCRTWYERAPAIGVHDRVTLVPVEPTMFRFVTGPSPGGSPATGGVATMAAVGDAISMPFWSTARTWTRYGWPGVRPARRPLLTSWPVACGIVCCTLKFNGCEPIAV